MSESAITLEKVREWRRILAENDAKPTLGGWYSAYAMLHSGDIGADEFAALLEFAEAALSRDCPSKEAST